MHPIFMSPDSLNLLMILCTVDDGIIHSHYSTLEKQTLSNLFFLCDLLSEAQWDDCTNLNHVEILFAMLLS